MITLNEITYLSGSLRQNEEIRKEFDVSWASLEKADISEDQKKKILALNFNNKTEELKAVLNNIGINPPK